MLERFINCPSWLNVFGFGLLAVVASGAERPEPRRLNNETVVAAPRGNDASKVSDGALPAATPPTDALEKSMASPVDVERNKPPVKVPEPSTQMRSRDRISLAARPKSNATRPANGPALRAAAPIEAASKAKNEKPDPPLPNPPEPESEAISPATEEKAERESADETQPSPLSPQQIQLRDRLRTALAYYYPKHLNARDHSPWEMMHGIIAYGTDALIFRSGDSGQTVSAVGWMCFNYPCRGEQLLYLDQGNRLVARKGPGLQGHYGQFLAILAQSHVSADYPMHVGNKEFTIRDLIEHEQSDCQSGEELTFKLIGLMHYLPSDSTWKARDGQTWSIPRLLVEEMRQPINGAACGGTHRLMGISYAVGKRLQRGEPVDGEYARAQKYIHDYHLYTFSLQNPDGSFSTEWFKRKGANPDLDRRLKTTGHTVEWLSYSLPEDQLFNPQMVKAVDYLTTILLNNRSHSWEVGPRGHALHALRIYDRRAFKPRDAQAQKPAELAKRDKPKGQDAEMAESEESESQSPPEPPAGIEAPTDEPAEREPRVPTEWDDEPDEGTPHLAPEPETTTAADQE